MDYIELLAYIPNVSFLVALLGIIIIAHRAKDSNFNLFDYFMDPSTGKASITKTLQIVAGITATWIVIRLAVKGSLSNEMFGIYLGALGVSEAWSKFVGAKYLTPKPSEPPEPPAVNG